LSASIAEARSCTDVLNTCMKIYNVTRGMQGASDPVASIAQTTMATCRLAFGPVKRRP
jgi:hypothetical protein